MADKTNAPTAASAPGLRGVSAATSSVSDVNGEKGQLIYQGYDIHDLAAHSTFEEVTFLLWNKRLPKREELDELKRALAASYELPREIFDLMKRFPHEADPIDVLRTTVSALEFYDPTSRDLSRAASIKTAIRLTAQLPTIVAASERIPTARSPSNRIPIGTNHVHVGQSLFHDIETASELGIPSIWVNRLGEAEDERPTRTLSSLVRLADTLDDLVPK